MHVCGIKCMYAETPGCMYADFGCMSMERLGACMRMLVQSMWLLGAKNPLLGASMRKLLGACIMLGASLWSGWVHA